MSWGKILKNKEKVEFFITLTEENMDKFSANDKEYVRLILKMLRENYSENIFQGLKILLKEYDIIGVKGVRKADESWRKNLKRGGKPKPKQTDVVVQFIKTNPRVSIAQIQRHLQNTFPSHMTTKRLRKFLESDSNIVVSGRYPTTYSYREGISKAKKKIPNKRIRDAIDEFVNAQDRKVTVREVQQEIIKKLGVMGMTEKPGSVKNYLFGWHTDKAEQFDPNIHRKDDFYYDLGDE